ncbi:hypothetical protein M667_16490 [Cellulophaga baltica NN016038]|nr:hypothetical protein M667_16490 [Cellulophaga baltica NN016038]
MFVQVGYPFGRQVEKIGQEVIGLVPVRMVVGYQPQGHLAFTALPVLVFEGDLGVPHYLVRCVFGKFQFLQHFLLCVVFQSGDEIGALLVPFVEQRIVVVSLVEQGDLSLADDALPLYEQRIVLPGIAMVDLYRYTGLHVQFLVALDAALALTVVRFAAGTLENGLEKPYGGRIDGIDLFIDHQLFVAVR